MATLQQLFSRYEGQRLFDLIIKESSVQVLVFIDLLAHLFWVVEVVLAVSMQVGANQSCASSSPLSSFLQGKTLACWEHTWAVHGGRAGIPTAPNPPTNISLLLQCVGTVKGKLGWSVGQAGRAPESSLPTGAQDQHAQIRGNLFHNIVASCFPRLGPHRRQRQGFGRWPSLFVGLLVRTTCAELDSLLILLAL